MWDLRRLHPDRARPPPGRQHRRARRIWHDQDRSDKRHRRSRCLPALRRPPPRRHHRQADALVAAAQNALLKTLEEPPSTASFMLVTSVPDVLLPTVLSRCPRLTFRRLGADDVATVLMRRGRSESEARAVAATADGSVGRALEASAGDLVEARDVALRALASVAGTAPGAPGDLPRRRVEAARDLLRRPCVRERPSVSSWRGTCGRCRRS